MKNIILAETKIAEKMVLLKELDDILELWVISPENGLRRLDIYKKTKAGRLLSFCDFHKHSQKLIEIEIYNHEEKLESVC